MGLLFELLEQMDSGSDNIIFFAGEGGSWQVSVDEEKVLRAYFTSLAALAGPEEYTQRALEVIKACGSYDREKFFKVAAKIANEAQRKALKAAHQA